MVDRTNPKGPLPGSPEPRSDPVTPNFQLTLPTVGLDRDTWGSLTNTNWSTVDTQLANVANAANSNVGSINALFDIVRHYVEPIGSLKFWPTADAPAGWAPCHGWGISRTSYADLFALIGTSYGAGDGSTTFNLPNFQGCVPVHFGVWIGFGARAGETAHVLSQNEMPAHNHDGWTDTQGEHTHTYTAPVAIGVALGPTSVPAPGTTGNTGTAGWHSHNTFTLNVGGGAAHNNVQPSVGLNMIIKISLIY